MKINGIVYYPLSPTMLKASDNRMPCPLCRTHIVEYYYTVWANQHGSERRYFCKCGAHFQVRNDANGKNYCVRKFPMIARTF